MMRSDDLMCILFRTHDEWLTQRDIAILIKRAGKKLHQHDRDALARLVDAGVIEMRQTKETGFGVNAKEYRRIGDNEKL